MFYFADKLSFSVIPKEKNKQTIFCTAGFRVLKSSSALGGWISAVESVKISFEVEKWMLAAQIAYCDLCELHHWHNYNF